MKQGSCPFNSKRRAEGASASRVSDTEKLVAARLPCLNGAPILIFIMYCMKELEEENGSLKKSHLEANFKFEVV